jgi:hypothetical protein
MGCLEMSEHIDETVDNITSEMQLRAGIAQLNNDFVTIADVWLYFDGVLVNGKQFEISDVEESRRKVRRPSTPIPISNAPVRSALMRPQVERYGRLESQPSGPYDFGNLERFTGVKPRPGSEGEYSAEDWKCALGSNPGISVVPDAYEESDTEPVERSEPEHPKFKVTGKIIEGVAPSKKHVGVSLTVEMEDFGADMFYKGDNTRCYDGEGNLRRIPCVTMYGPIGDAWLDISWPLEEILADGTMVRARPKSVTKPVPKDVGNATIAEYLISN